jgi:hypothetical protein
MEIESLIKHNEKPTMARAKEFLSHVKEWDWIFSTPLEKILVSACILWTAWSITSLTYNFIFQVSVPFFIQ